MPPQSRPDNSIVENDSGGGQTGGGRGALAGYVGSLASASANVGRYRSAQSGYVLLTGSTGLVGRYLLAELLRRGIPVVVLVRSRPGSSPAARLEEALQPLEHSSLLPRPVVMCGDLTVEQCGLELVDVEWLRRNVRSVLHSAASIRFSARDPQGSLDDQEPYLSNVRGTENLLQLCGSLNVADFHYVSTAYVGCRRACEAVSSGGAEAAIAYEEAVDLSTTAGNDYERSKIIAEDLVARSDVSRTTTIHRPSIVIGDSQTGYSSTFHGFFAPLKIGAEFAKSFGSNPLAGDWFRERLGLREQDRKNLVPVDWLARSIASVVTDHKRHGGIYHWVNPEPVTCSLMEAVITDSILAKYPRGQGDLIGAKSHSSAILPGKDAAVLRQNDESDSAVLSQFDQHMASYQSYFVTDPYFDDTRAREVTADDPCPAVDYSRLRRMADYALQVNFGWPKPRIVGPRQGGDSDWVARYPSLAEGEASDPTTRFRLVCYGPWSPGPVEFVRSGQQDWRVLASGAGWQNGTEVCVRIDVLLDCLMGAVDISATLATGQWLILRPPHDGWLAILEGWIQYGRLECPGVAD